MDKAFVSYSIEERSYVSYIKREIHSQAVAAQFTAIRTAEIDLIVSEITSNIIKHAGHGQLLYRIQKTGREEPTFEIISIDNGPGISDTIRMTKDGISTTQTLGQGLGSINRLSSFSQLYSIPGWGTILYAIVKAKDKKIAREKSAELEVTALCVNKPRETVCGDGYRVKQLETGTLIFFADGLGHGHHAKDAVDRAGEVFFRCNETDPVEIIRRIHADIRKTRGLVATIAGANLKTRLWSLCGVGNVSTRIYNGVEHRNSMSYNGTIGLTIPNSMTASSYPLESNQHLIMCTDGIQTRWDLTRYPAILKYHNMVLAAAIYKDFFRKNDDSSILIAKIP
jgi:anti-sigma regulatory factor (Ser/Thr protein kinase)